MEINIVLTGQRIRAARKEKKVSSEVLAEKVGIAVESLWHIENGARNTSLQTLCNIAEALDVPVDYLLGRMDSLLNPLFGCVLPHMPSQKIKPVRSWRCARA
jgi:transcriptional regulator with XRE-family HTH domain